MRPVALILLAAGVLGCGGGRWMPKAPAKMLPPPPVCPVRPAAALDLPQPPRGTGRVALLRPRGPEAHALPMWKRLQLSLQNSGYTVMPFGATDGSGLECSGVQTCDLEPLRAVIGEPSSYAWVVTAVVGPPPAHSRLAAIAVQEGRGRPMTHLEFTAYAGDLVVPITAPTALASAMASRDDPPPPPQRAELVLAQCVATDHDDAACPGFRPSDAELVELSPPPPGAERVVWRDGDIEVTLALAEVESMLTDMTRDAWDERRAEWASSRLSHLRRLHRRGEEPWLSSWVAGRQRDPRMDGLVRSIVGSGAAEIHLCTGPLVEYLVAEPIATARGEQVMFRLPDGAELLRPPG